jgi:hypothetical protein
MITFIANVLMMDTLCMMSVVKQRSLFLNIQE